MILTFFFLKERKPTFSSIFGENIEVELDSARNPWPVKANWKFSKSCGLAFSGFSLKANKIYEVIFSGSGHARMGFTQTDPNYLLDIQQAVTKKQIMLVSDIRLHNRQCVLDIVKKVDANGSKFEAMYKQDNPKIKEILPSIDVWAVIYLKFGYIKAHLKGNFIKIRLQIHNNSSFIKIKVTCFTKFCMIFLFSN